MHADKLTMDHQQDKPRHQQPKMLNDTAVGGGGAPPSATAATSISNLCVRQSSTRWIPTTEQIRILRDLYYNSGLRSPTSEQIQRISSKLRQYGKIEGKNVFYWFQNHKARERQKRKLAQDHFIGNSNPRFAHPHLNNNLQLYNPSYLDYDHLSGVGGGVHQWNPSSSGINGFTQTSGSITATGCRSRSIINGARGSSTFVGGDSDHHRSLRPAPQGYHDDGSGGGFVTGAEKGGGRVREVETLQLFPVGHAHDEEEDEEDKEEEEDEIQVSQLHGFQFSILNPGGENGEEKVGYFAGFNCFNFSCGSGGGEDSLHDVRDVGAASSLELTLNSCYHASLTDER